MLKDLIVDMEPFFDGYKAVMPYLINDGGEPRTASASRRPEERERYDDTTKCILCAACTTSCPIFWGDEEYVGPAAIVNAHRFIFDSRDEAGRERLEDPVGEDRRVPMPDDLQLHRRLPPRHQGHEGDPGSEARDPVRAVLGISRSLAGERPRQPRRSA